jgi:hypothetical protein
MNILYLFIDFLKRYEILKLIKVNGLSIGIIINYCLACKPGSIEDYNSIGLQYKRFAK